MKLSRKTPLETNAFSETEIETILSLAVFWREVKDKPENDQIFLTEYRALTNYISPKKLLKAINNMAIEEATND